MYSSTYSSLEPILVHGLFYFCILPLGLEIFNSLAVLGYKTSHTLVMRYSTDL